MCYKRRECQRIVRNADFRPDGSEQILPDRQRRFNLADLRREIGNRLEHLLQLDRRVSITCDQLLNRPSPDVI